MPVIDCRKNGKNKAAENRKRFVNRYKRNLKEVVDNIIQKQKVKDLINDQPIIVTQENSTAEPSFEIDAATGDYTVVRAGNEKYKRGDKIYKSSTSSKYSGSGRGNGDDAFLFTLTKEELINIFFEGMGLPNFIKKSLKNTVKERIKRAGYTKEGIPARLDLLKTFKQAKARRLATGSKRFLEDVDMRYKLFTKIKEPISHAVVFFMLDKSASMEEEHKFLAKKFFLLFYLFLNKHYKSVEIIFIKHTEVAMETTEEDFFYGHDSGGTRISSGLSLINEIIDKRYDISLNNIYIAQASDGDLWIDDSEECPKIVEVLLTKCQYFAYIEIDPTSRYNRPGDYTLSSIYKPIVVQKDNFNEGVIKTELDIYPVLRELFKND